MRAQEAETSAEDRRPPDAQFLSGPALTRLFRKRLLGHHRFPQGSLWLRLLVLLPLFPMATPRAKWRPSLSTPQARQSLSVDDIMPETGGEADAAQAEGEQLPRDAARRRTNTQGEFKADGPQNSGRGKKGRRRRRTKPAQDAKPKKLTTNDNQLRQLLSLMLRLQLQTQQQVRMMQGILCDSIFMPRDSEIEVKNREEMAAIQAEAAKRRAASAGDTSAPPLALGPPTRTLAMSLLEALLEMDIGSGNKAAIQELHAKWTAIGNEDPTKIDEEIQLIRISPGEFAQRTRLTIAMPRGQDRTAILKALAAVKDFDIKVGGAPPGWLEEELMEWVDALGGVTAK